MKSNINLVVKYFKKEKSKSKLGFFSVNKS